MQQNKNKKNALMIKNIKVSVIVPIYNIEEYLKQCIESIISQTHNNLEIILVDDGSTDSSGQICDKYAKKDNRIIVIHKVNGGLVSARKAGLDIAIGDYIAFVDGDDWIEPNMYEFCLNLLLKEGAEFVDSGYYEEIEESGSCKNHPLNNLISNSDLKIVKKWICEWMRNSALCPIRSTIWSKLYRATLIKKAYFFVPDDLSKGEDLICFINLVILLKEKICVTSKIFYHYRNRKDSLSHDNSFNYYVINQDLYAYMKRLIDKRIPQLSSQVEEWRLKVAKNGLRSVLYVNKIFFKQAMYQISNINKLFNKKIVLYGAGSVGREYYSQIVQYEKCQLVAWVDKNYSTIRYDYYNIKPVNYILKINYDIIIIAVLRKELASTIKDELLCKGITEEKIVWIKPYDIRDELR